MELSVLHRKQTIVFTTIDIINEFGIQGVSTREIAKRQGIAESTIFKHFKTKSDILLAVLDFYAQYDSDIIISTKYRIENPIEAILFYIRAYTEYYENYPAITAITQAYDVISYDSELSGKVRSIFFTRTDFIKELVEAAKNAGQLNPHTDTEQLKDIIWGTNTAICLRWRFDRYSFSLTEQTLAAIKAILQAFNSK